jgi:hypothetical protein
MLSPPSTPHLQRIQLLEAGRAHNAVRAQIQPHHIAQHTMRVGQRTQAIVREVERAQSGAFVQRGERRDGVVSEIQLLQMVRVGENESGCVGESRVDRMSVWMRIRDLDSRIE